tara:strand:+ start:411 stop:1043 length:633 start_codon:yes stop_codon:yes gene_type:complete
LDIYNLVVEFQKKVLNNKPYFDLPNDQEFLFMVNTLEEELQEFKDGYKNKSYNEMADALIDLIYFALGHSFRMGINFNDNFLLVHKANMQKIKAKTNRGETDAEKPEGWQEPEFKSTLKMPLLFIDAAKVQQDKDQDYNNKNSRKEYFPFGLKSYIQMIWIKVLRMVNVVDKEKVFNEPLHDSIIDLVNYASFLYDEIYYDELDTEFEEE